MDRPNPKIGLMCFEQEPPNFWPVHLSLHIFSIHTIFVLLLDHFCYGLNCTGHIINRKFTFCTRKPTTSSHFSSAKAKSTAFRRTKQIPFALKGKRNMILFQISPSLSKKRKKEKFVFFLGSRLKFLFEGRGGGTPVHFYLCVNFHFTLSLSFSIFFVHFIFSVWLSRRQI